MPKNYKTNKTNIRKQGAKKQNIAKPGNDCIMHSRINDASWYAENPSLLRDAANLPYGYPVGARINVGMSEYTVPGIMKLKVHPLFGISRDNYSAVNIAARNIYSYVRHANSGSSRYDAPDLMLYIMGMSNVYALFSHMKRIYGVARLYTQVNRYYPNAVLEAMGVKPDDVFSHLADLRYYINQLAVKIGSMCIPKSMTIFARHMWLYEGIYVDSTSAKAQSYLFVPDGFYRFDEFNGPGNLVYTSFNPGDAGYTVQNLYEYVSGMLDLILSSEDMQIMSGDILKAYGPDGVFKVAGVDENYVVLPAYNEEVLSQIQNCTIVGTLAEDNITQDTNNGAILCDPKKVWSGLPADRGSAIYSPFKNERILNMYKDEVNPADTMVATRLMAIAKDVSYGGNGMKVTFEHLGTEVITEASYAEFMEVEGEWKPSWQPFEYILPMVQDNAEQSTFITYVQAVNKLLRITEDITPFRYHPAFMVSKLVVNTSGFTTNYSRPIIDYNNYTIVDEATLGRMHETAVLSELACPQMGAFSNKLA